MRSTDWLSMRNVRTVRAVDLGDFFWCRDLYNFLHTVFPLGESALTAVEVDVFCVDIWEARKLFGVDREPRSKVLFPRVRARSLGMASLYGDQREMRQFYSMPSSIPCQRDTACDVQLLRLAVAQQHPLRYLKIAYGWLSNAEADLGAAAADVALKCSLDTLKIDNAAVVGGPSLLLQLTRVLRHGAVRTLLVRGKVGGPPDGSIFSCEGGSAGADPVRPFCTALHAAPVVRLTLSCVGLFDCPEHAARLFHALQGHRTLRCLNISFNRKTHFIWPREESATAAAAELIASIVREDA